MAVALICLVLKEGLNALHNEFVIQSRSWHHRKEPFRERFWHSQSRLRNINIDTWYLTIARLKTLIYFEDVSWLSFTGDTGWCTIKTIEVNNRACPGLLIIETIKVVGYRCWEQLAYRDRVRVFSVVQWGLVDLIRWILRNTFTENIPSEFQTLAF